MFVFFLGQQITSILPSEEFRKKDLVELFIVTEAFNIDRW